jgi:hypothetical protein
MLPSKKTKLILGSLVLVLSLAGLSAAFSLVKKPKKETPSKAAEGQCTVSISSSKITEAQTINVDFSGKPSTSDNVQLWLEQTNGNPVSNPAKIQYNGGSYLNTTTSNGKTYYRLASASDSSQHTGTLSLPPGKYFLHCDVNVAIGVNRCSGNPFCNYETTACQLCESYLCGSDNCSSSWANCSNSDNLCLEVTSSELPTLIPPELYDTSSTISDFHRKFEDLNIEFLMDQINTNLSNPTYGCWDKDYWGGSASTSDPRKQEAVLTIIHAYYENPKYQNREDLKKAIGGTYIFYEKFIDGAIPDNGYYGRIFTPWILEESYKVIKKYEGPDSYKESVLTKTKNRLLNDMRSGLSNGYGTDNQVMGMILGLYTYAELFNDASLRTETNTFTDKLLSRQKSSGYFPEDGGFDAAYSNVQLGLLNKIYRVTNREDVLKAMIGVSNMIDKSSAVINDNDIVRASGTRYPQALYAIQPRYTPESNTLLYGSSLGEIALPVFFDPWIITTNDRYDMTPWDHYVYISEENYGELMPHSEKYKTNTRFKVFNFDVSGLSDLEKGTIAISLNGNYRIVDPNFIPKVNQDYYIYDDVYINQAIRFIRYSSSHESLDISNNYEFTIESYDAKDYFKIDQNVYRRENLSSPIRFSTGETISTKYYQIIINAPFIMGSTANRIYIKPDSSTIRFDFYALRPPMPATVQADNFAYIANLKYNYSKLNFKALAEKTGRITYSAYIKNAPISVAATHNGTDVLLDWKYDESTDRVNVTVDSSAFTDFVDIRILFPPLAPNSCVVSVSNSKIAESQTVNVNFSGQPSAGNKVQLWLEEVNGNPLIHPEKIKYNDGSYLNSATSNNKTYYRLDSSADSGQRSGTLSLPEGKYFLHCDVNVTTGVNRCSGNPFCDYEVAACQSCGSTSCSSENCSSTWTGCSNSDSSCLEVTSSGTPTSTPSIRLPFKIKFQGINSQKPDKTVRVILKQNNVEKYRFESVAVNSNTEGVYSGTTPEVAPGTYEVFIKGQAHLQKKFAGVTINSTMIVQDWSSGSLKVGDFDNNNVLNITDVSGFLSVYNSLSVPVTSQNQIYDINADNIININDVSLVLANYTSLEVRGDE